MNHFFNIDFSMPNTKQAETACTPPDNILLDVVISIIGNEPTQPSQNNKPATPPSYETLKQMDLIY